MIEWRVFKGDKPSPVFTIMQVFLEDWKKANPSYKDLDGFALLEIMGLVAPGAPNMRLERVEVQWRDKEGRELEEVSTIVKKPSRAERRRIEREFNSKWAKLKEEEQAQYLDQYNQSKAFLDQQKI
jgi:hypothetical protein